MTHRLSLILLFAAVQSAAALSALPGFSVSPYFSEQVKTFVFTPEVRLHINAPSVAAFDPAKPTALVFYALPNGNTIEMTVGKQLKAGDDWHYDIQHIGAQTRFVRSKVKDTNVVVIYCEANAASVPLSWPTWRSKYANDAALVKGIVDSMRTLFAPYAPYVVLSSHSGGGGFEFSYFDAAAPIPAEVKRITFLDATYNYDNAYGAKIKDWLLGGPDRHLSVLAYNDSIALLNGQPIVSPTGGTWYRTRQMVSYLSGFMTFTTVSDASFITHTALDGRVKILLKQNPAQAILHTVQVELNGFIQTMLSGTPREGSGYTYYGARAYTSLVQTSAVLPVPMQIPARPAGSLTGSQFMNSLTGLSFTARENAIYAEFAKGNVPDFLRTPVKLQSSFQDANGVSHAVVYEVMPDYLAVGTDTDYCRVPMGPVTAQKIANLFGGVMPTAKLVDDIYAKAPLKVAPLPLSVPDADKVTPATFLSHNGMIEQQRLSSGLPLGTLMGGTKKDVVISNKITDPTRPGNVVIYGWHQLNGTPIQPLTNIHSASYVDYSHGVRLMNAQILVDSVTRSVKTMLTDAVQYKVLSNETGAMTQPSYVKETNAPAVPKSFGVRSESPTSLRVVVKPDTNASEYIVYMGKDGLTFTDTLTLPAAAAVITGLQTDSVYYVRLRASNNAGVSAVSEALAGVPIASGTAPALIVNGFDRASAGNTYNFIRQHAGAFQANGMRFASATNDAVTDGLFSLGNHTIADYILGDESTADETFSAAEQTLVKAFLQGGGDLFVSGCEIGWDLDRPSVPTAVDRDFFNNFLKMKYVADAPNNTKQTTYQAEVLAGTPFAGVPAMAFDNGTHGTIDVQWPDVVRANGGGVPFAKYTGLDTASGVSGVCFAGVFPGGTAKGSVVALSFPFETIYTKSVRDQLMGKALEFFAAANSVSGEPLAPERFTLHQNYPNPFNPSTTISYSIEKSGAVSLIVYDALGREVRQLVASHQPAGRHSVIFNGASLASGIYFARLSSGSYSSVIKMSLMK